MAKIYINTPQQRYEVVGGERTTANEVAAKLKAQQVIKVGTWNSDNTFLLILHPNVEWRVHSYD